MAYRREFLEASVVVAALAMTNGLTACGGGTGASDPPQAALQQSASQASADVFSVLAIAPGVTPFISFVEIGGSSVQDLAGVEFTIAPKPGSVSNPVHVRYSLAALSREQLSAEQGSSVLRVLESTVRVPVFGLYAGYQNQVLVQLDFQDGSTKSLPVVITTAPYTDPNGIYDRPTILKPRAAGSALGFDFFVLKSGLESPVIVDTDGQLRWVGGAPSGTSSAVINDGFSIGSPVSPTLYHLRFDGTLTQSRLSDPRYFDFNHNIDHGKVALFADVDANDFIEASLIETAVDGTINKEWDLANILSSYMSTQGDNASAFVRPGVDWFHMNASAYDPADDSVIVSSRENFLIKVDYNTGSIKWILGDPTKYWYTFPSLRAKALTLESGGLYPVGQHAVSITSDGLVMVFNDGLGSFNQPAGASAGISRAYSAVSAYSIDPINRTAREVWRFDYGQSIYANVCSSSYEAPGGSYLVDFATADSGADARLVGLDSEHNVVFDFRYQSPSTCSAAWNAVPIALEDLSIL